ARVPRRARRADAPHDAPLCDRAAAGRRTQGLPHAAPPVIRAPSLRRARRHATEPRPDQPPSLSPGSGSLFFAGSSFGSLSASSFGALSASSFAASPRRVRLAVGAITSGSLSLSETRSPFALFFFASLPGAAAFAPFFAGSAPFNDSSSAFNP